MSLAKRRNKKKRWGQIIASELNVLPLMNLFIVLIPLLLLSAVFIEVSVIEMNQSSAEEEHQEPLEESLALAIRILDDAYIVEGNGIDPRTILRRLESSTTSERESASSRVLARALAEIIATFPNNLSVQIIAEETTHYEDIIMVMDISRDAGLTQTALVGAANGEL